MLPAGAHPPCRLAPLSVVLPLLIAVASRTFSRDEVLLAPFLPTGPEAQKMAWRVRKVPRGCSTFAEKHVRVFEPLFLRAALNVCCLAEVPEKSQTSGNE